MSLKDFIRQIPKAELHLHIEGSFEPELMFEIARRNNIDIPYNSIEEVKQAYEFNNLQGSTLALAGLSIRLYIFHIVNIVLPIIF